MPSPAESILLSKLSNGDKEWEEKVITFSKNPDDLPILPSWNLQSCEEFFDKAVAHGGAGGPPPVQTLVGDHPVRPVTAAGIQQLQFEIMTYLVSTNPGASIIGGANALQFGIACGQLRGLEMHPWFLAVLSHGAPLTGTWHPCTCRVHDWHQGSATRFLSIARCGHDTCPSNKCIGPSLHYLDQHQ